jgi:methylenetetrahydrofolate dehydrogenase (NADP+) / methenyltetrahydrofolate cyclohydrolase
VGVSLILSGREVARQWQETLRDRVRALAERGRRPGLVMVRVGEDPASVVYVRGKEKISRELGLESRTVVLPESTPTDELLALIDRLNADPAVDGFIVQFPLPAHLSEDEVLLRVAPEKDVDGLHPLNVGLLCQGHPRFLPATPAGILRILTHFRIEIAGRHAVIVGRSNLVGRPLANLLSAKSPRGNATVTMCHTATADLARHTRSADILVAAAGRKHLITADMVSPDAVVIDVGIHREPDPERPGKERLCGDVDFAAVEKRVRAITPVPGGVGPTTVMSLIENTILAAERR